MPELIQLIGPEACGKTTLRRMMAPNAVDISHCFGGMFNKCMEFYEHGYYFEEIDARHLTKLEGWLNGELVRIERMGMAPIHVTNIGPWVYCGIEAIEVPGSLIWRVAKVG